MAAIVIDKINTFLVLSVFAFAGIISFISVASGFWFIAIVVGVLFWIGIFFSTKGRLFIKNVVLKKYALLFTGFFKHIKILYRKHFLFVFFNLLSTIILWSALGAFIWMIFVNFGQAPFLHEVIFIHAMGVLSAFIPISISGLGVRESLVVGLFHLRGIAPEQTVAIYLLFLFFSYLFAATAFFLFKKEWKKAYAAVTEVRKK